MSDRSRLSPKLHMTAKLGFALHDSRQPAFRRDWHMHDCSMLLWPCTGSLKAVWDATPDTCEQTPDGRQATTLVRGMAVLLPANTSHLTVSLHRHQHHGELYLPPDRTPHGRRHGALRLDAPTMAMLEALLAPSISERSATWLVRAVVEQIEAGRPLAVADTPATVAVRMVRRFIQALEHDQPLPLIDAVASELGISVRQLQRACQDELGATPVAIRRRVLATHARALMDAGRSPASVSVQLGFASSSHLHRLLREVAASP